MSDLSPQKMIEGFFKNDWSKTVVGSVLAVLLLRLIDWLFINDFFWHKAKAFFVLILDFFNTAYPIKLYWLILIAVMPLLVLYGYKRLKSRDRVSLPKEVTIDVPPNWISYTKDVFEGIQYRWGYSFDREKYHIGNIRAYCNKCNCQIVDNTCPNCKSYYSDSSYIGGSLKHAHEVEALVIHRIENNLYKTQ